MKTAEEEAYFEKCKSYKDFKTYLSIYPNARHKDIATKIIKRHNNKMLCSVILVLAIVGAIGRMIWANSDKEPGNSTFTDSTSEITHNTPLSNPVPPENNSDNYDYGAVEPAQTNDSHDSEYRDNSLSTGSRPYRSYFGRSLTGGHKMSFKTDTGSDYVVIIKRHGNNRYIDHIYIKGGDNASMKVPDGTYDVYFYSGNGWNPYKQNGEREGGFVENAALQKDGPVILKRRYEGDYYYDQTLSYTLYPVYNGNLALQKASEEEAF